LCAFPIFVWAIFSYLYAFPGYVLRLSVWDLIGTASYTLAFALVESLVIMVPFVLLAVILPAPFFKDRGIALTAIIVFISSIWIAYANYHQINLGDWDVSQSLPGVLLYLISIAIPIALVIRWKRINDLFQAFIQRLAVLVYIYAALACLGVLIVLFRNL
jgi:hypothetical protein